MKLRPPYISSMKIEDNFLDHDKWKELHDYMTSWEFPWFMQPTLTYGNDDLEAFGFNHWLTAEEHPIFAHLVEQMESALNARNVLRVRADMTILNPNGYRHGWHVDEKEPHWVCIYYVNDSDGNTLLRDPLEGHGYMQVEPKANRLLLFDGKIEHTGHSPSEHKNRILINANFSKN